MHRPFAKRLLLFTLFLIYFLDIGGIGVAFVVFAPLILSEASPLFDAALSMHDRNLIIGFLAAAYPFTQFIGSPIIGELSDRLGRKPLLLFSTAAAFITFGMSAIAISMKSLPFLFVSRLLGGLAAGAAGVTQASISDFVEEDKRASYQAQFSVAGGLAWVFCPFLASLLSDQKIASWFSYSLPFWFMGALFLISFFLLLLWKKGKVKSLRKSPGELSLKRIVLDIFDLFEMPKVVFPLLLSLTVMFAWILYQGFTAPYLMQRFDVSQLKVGIFFAYFSAWWTLGGLSAKWLLKRFSAEKSNLAPMYIIALSIIAFLLTFRTEGIWISTAFSNFFQAISISCFFGIFSHTVQASKQGKIFGFWNAGVALSAALGPALAGYLSRYFLTLPFLISGAIALACALLYHRWLLRKVVNSTS